jgi:hypothetical protein
VLRFVASSKTSKRAGSLAPGCVKGVQGAPGVFEMSWANGGRATFEYGREIRAGEPHIIWRRVGTHSIFGIREAT